MSDTSSTTSFRANISELKTAMQQAARQVRLAESEFKKATAGLDDWSSSAVGLSAKCKQLNTTLEAQRKRADAARKEFELMAKEYGENSAEADRAKIKLNSYEAAVAKTEKELRSYQSELKDCENETGKFSKETEQAGKTAKDASEGFTVMKGALSVLVAMGIKAAITGLKNLASAAKEAYDEFDKGADAVIKATGATGAAGKELEQNYANVSKRIVGDMEDIGEAVGEVSTRFGFTGDQLEATSEQFLKFADITGTDAKEAVRLVSRAMENAGIEAKDYKKLLDILAKAGQETGVDIASLAEQVTKNGATMRQLGYSTEETIAMLAQFEKSGVNSETAITGLKTAVKNWGKEGKNAREEYSKALEDIKNTPDITEATAKAIEVFGSKAGPELVEDIQAGKLEYQDFLKTLKTSTGTVEKTYEATKDGFDKINLAIQEGRVELGQYVRSLATEYQDKIVEVISKIKEGIKNTIDFIVRNGDVIMEVIKSIAKIAITLFAVKKAAAMAAAITKIVATVKSLVTALKAGQSVMSAMKATGGILASLVSPGGAIVLGLAAIAAVTATIITLTKKEAIEIEVLSDAQKKSIENSHKMKEAYEELDTARRNSLGEVEAEHRYYTDLLKELDSLVGANGKVKEGYEDRVKFILTTLNEAYGTEMQLIDGVIENYVKERQELTKLMETKRAQAILDANESAYTEAIQKRTEATQTYMRAMETYNEAMAKTKQKQQEVNDIMTETAKLYTSEGPGAAKEFLESHGAVLSEYEKLKGSVTETRQALKEATEAYQGYNQIIENHEGLSSAIITGDSEKIRDELTKTENSLKTHTQTTADELKKQADEMTKYAQDLSKRYSAGELGITAQMVSDAENLAKLAREEYEKSGKNTVAGYVSGIEEEEDQALLAIKQLGYDSVAEFNEAMGIKSPSTKTYKSGEYFVEGYINGMDSKESEVYKKAYKLAQAAIQGLKEGQQEGSPSKLTFKSGKQFTQGYINGIASMTKQLIKSIKNVTTLAIKKGLHFTYGDFDSAATSVVDAFTESLNGKTQLMLDKISYQNEQKLKEFDEEIEKLQEQMKKENNKHAEEVYTGLINEQKKAKEAYQTASQKMISQFTNAMNNYQTKATELITTTVQGISAKYSEEYNALLEKQESLIEKLRDTGDLFEVSGAGVLTISDIREQTKQITDYTEKLQRIKERVSSELFNQITTYDMAEGSAFVDQLMEMSKGELDAYDRAYLDKLDASKKAASLYADELEDVEVSYTEAIREALEDLPTEMEDLGATALKSFLSGLTENTDYMSQEIKTFVSGMVDTFKKQLDLPGMSFDELGADMGIDMTTGMDDMRKKAQAAASTVSSAVSSKGLQGGMGTVHGMGGVINNYNLVQNNNSPKSLSALDTYMARRQQVEMLKAMT